MSEATGAAGRDADVAGARAIATPSRERIIRAVETAFAEECERRRPFLWRVAAAGAGVLLYFAAEREPPLLLCVAAVAAFSAGAVAAGHRRARALFVGAALIAAGFACGAWRSARVAAPVTSRAGVGELTGFVEEVDLRRTGARFLLRVASAEGLPGDVVPTRVRLTTRGEPRFAAGDFVALKARLLPPARAPLPGGYDFARDAWFAGIGGVGNALGRIETMPPPDPAPPGLRFFAAIDRMRNALALRVFRAIGDDAGAIAAAMVTGKRDFLSENAKELIRRAGIFHIVTISGMQMTMVAGIFFVGVRRLLALSQTLALDYPIKKWAAALAMVGAVLYDLATGSRVGAERALAMTLIMLGAVLLDRPALSMRNLALAAAVVIVLEPEALVGASFQLSFSAVAALIAVYETRGDGARAPYAATAVAGRLAEWRAIAAERATHGPGAALVATLCATGATAAFMAADFHELSPYVLIGNPLTLAVIEFFAVPCALVGAALYPVGLDGVAWRWLHMGIDLVVWLARGIADAPGASLSVPAFAPWAPPFFTLAVLSAVLWRSWTLRATALPFLLLGLLGATRGAPFDIAVPPAGDAIALRLASGALTLVGKKPGSFAAEQWLRADADPRAPAAARTGGETACDDLGCVARAQDGRLVALALASGAFVEDCARAAIIVTPLRAPSGCAAPVVIDRRALIETGAVSLRLGPGDEVTWTRARAIDEDRPWSPRPPPAPRAGAMGEEKDDEAATLSEPLD